MANIEYSNDIVNPKVFMAIYGVSGVGKTYALASLRKNLVIAVENGVLALKAAGTNTAFVRTSSIAEIKAFALRAEELLAKDPENAPYETISIDSVSALCEEVISKLVNARTEDIDYLARDFNVERGKIAEGIRDGRMAYSKMGTMLEELLRFLSNLPHLNVVCVFKQGRVANDRNVMELAPSIPGKTAVQNIAYAFDEVLAIRVVKDQNGAPQRQVLTQYDGEYIAKDRSGQLSIIEEPDLQKLMDKIKGVTNGSKN